MWNDLKMNKKHKCMICGKQRLTLGRYADHMLFFHQVSLTEPVFEEYCDSRTDWIGDKESADSEELKTLPVIMTVRQERDIQKMNLKRNLALMIHPILNQNTVHQKPNLHLTTLPKIQHLVIKGKKEELEELRKTLQPQSL